MWKKVFRRRAATINRRLDGISVFERYPAVEQLEQRRLLAALPATELQSLVAFVEDVDREKAVQNRPVKEDLSVVFRPYVPTRHDYSRHAGFLTGPSNERPLSIVLDFLRSHSDELELNIHQLNNFTVTDKYTSTKTGTTHIYLQQTYDALPIAGASVSANVAADGSLVNLSSSFVKPELTNQAKNGTRALGALEALQSLADAFDWNLQNPVILSATTSDPSQLSMLSAEGVARDDIPARLQYVPTVEGLELSWNLQIATIDNAHWYNAHVSAHDGKVLGIVDWVADAQYNIFPVPLESPADAGRSFLVDPHDLAASPFGWHDTNGIEGAEFTDTRGNNVTAQEDRDGNDRGGFRPDGGRDLDFDFPFDPLAQAAANQDAAITNLFYWNNILHDIHFAYGFDEAAGNFQETNYSGQGLAGDPVQADALDGEGTNNANFATPPDGTTPRMQMFVFDISAPSRAGSFDNGIIIHEYGHGVSHRLTGGPNNSDGLFSLQSGAMGEGWSDWWTLMFTQTESDQPSDAIPIGTYVLGQSAEDAGIRRFPYSFDMDVNPLTYGDFNTNSEVHDGGEIWAATLWDMNWLLIEKFGFDEDLYGGNGGNNLALQLVIDGLKLQPTQPSFLDARDAILQADMLLTEGDNQSEIWEAFSRRGMGFNATDGGSANSTGVRESFDLPPTSRGTIFLDRDSYEVGDLITIRVGDNDIAGQSSINVTLTSSGGDEEIISLDRIHTAGIFQAIVPSDVGTPQADNILQVRADDVIRVTYEDADDGSGSPAIVNDDALAITLIGIYLADFEDVSSGASEEGFTSSGPTNQWHISSGRSADSGHSAGNSFYFGAGEGPNGGGAYEDNSVGTLTSPVIDLRQSIGLLTFEFNYFLRAENGFDVASVAILSEGIQTVILDNLSIGGLSSNTGKFVPVSIDISQYVGKQIQIEFSFVSDFLFTFEGWYIDDIAVKAPPRERGVIELDSLVYEAGREIVVTVGDVDLKEQDSILVEVNAESGDSESLVLLSGGGGLFRGSIPTAIGRSAPNGTLEVVSGDLITVSYLDEDNGDGNSVIISDVAAVIALIDVFHADFRRGDTEGFTSLGTNNQWHISQGRREDAGHSSRESFYFGAGESAAGGGVYLDNADGTLISPQIDLVGVTDNVTLSFNHFLDIEDFYDLASVAVVVDGITTVIADSESVGGLASDVEGFTLAVFDLSRFIGEVIQIQFRLQSDISITGEGWYVDDIVVRGTPVDSKGTIRFNEEVYGIDEPIEITLTDADLAGLDFVSVSVETVGGDLENVELTRIGDGIFRGSIFATSGRPNQNGSLEVNSSDMVTVKYLDDDDGQGNQSAISDTASVIALIEIYNADFSTESDRPFSEGFTLSGTINQWHLSEGRGDDSGHSSTSSFYFGTGENSQGGGFYQDNADGTLTSPMIDLTQVTENVTLNFNHFVNVEETYDIVSVGVVTGGVTTLLADNSIFGGPLTNTRDFVPVQFDLSQFFGQTIQIQFHFQSDQFLFGEGWYVDDVIVRGTPLDSLGSVNFESEIYEIGRPITITLTDIDLADRQTTTVQIVAESGDIETVTLNRLFEGGFRGEIPSVLGLPATDGVLQVNTGDTITLNYLDEDNGQGNSIVDSDIATVISIVDLFIADFSTESGRPVDEGFTSTGPRNQWHLSQGRRDDLGHSSSSSFYFGANEGPTGGGTYQSNADGTLISPEIDLTQVSSNVSLSFNHFSDFEEFFDYIAVTVVSGGETVPIADSGLIGGLVSRTDGFVPVQFDLSLFVGTVIQIQFHFLSDDLISGEGWYVDDIVVRGVLGDDHLITRIDLNGDDDDGSGFNTRFLAGRGPVPIVDTEVSGPLSISTDNTRLAGAIITILNPQDAENEILSVDTMTTAIEQNLVNNVLRLSGSDLVENYETVLRTLTYDNLAVNPTVAERTISVVVSDETTTSEAAIATVAVLQADNGPVVVEHDRFTVNQNGRLVVTAESHPAGTNAVGSGVAANDTTDSRDINHLHTVVLVTGPRSSINDQPSGDLVLHPDGTFEFTPEFYFSGQVEFTYKVDDGFGIYGPGKVIINVTPPPRIVTTDRNDRAERFDRLTSYSVTFSKDVSASLDLNDITIVNLATESEVDLSNATVSWDPLTNIARWDLSDITFDPGYYRVIIDSSGINDEAGNRLDGDNDGISGPNYQETIIVALAGDTDLDGDIDSDDIFNILSATKFGIGPSNASWLDGDFNDDDQVDAHDIISIQIALAGNFPFTYAFVLQN